VLLDEAQNALTGYIRTDLGDQIAATLHGADESGLFGPAPSRCGCIIRALVRLAWLAANLGLIRFNYALQRDLLLTPSHLRPNPLLHIPSRTLIHLQVAR